MSSRDDILASIRANLPRVDRPLPYVPAFDDDPPASLLDAFKASLHRMGGMFLDPPAAGDILAPVACARFLSCQSREQPATRPIETEEESHGPDHQDSAF
jgi:hypothetical protein